MGTDEPDSSKESNREYVTIPSLYRGKEVIETKEVPKAWVEQKDRAYRVLDELRTEYREHPDVRSMACIASDRTFGGMRGFKVEVELLDMAVAPEIPAERDDIEIETVEATDGALL